MIVERLFARKDYEGLTEEGQKKLKEVRSKMAKALLDKRQASNKRLKEDLEMPDWKKIKTYMNKHNIPKEDKKTIEAIMFDEEALKGRKKYFEDQLKNTRKSADKVREGLLKKFKEKAKEEVVKESSQQAIPPSPSTPEFFKKNKKALLIGTGVAGLGGLGYYGLQRARYKKSGGYE